MTIERVGAHFEFHFPCYGSCLTLWFVSHAMVRVSRTTPAIFSLSDKARPCASESTSKTSLRRRLFEKNFLCRSNLPASLVAAWRHHYITSILKAWIFGSGSGERENHILMFAFSPCTIK